MATKKPSHSIDQFTEPVLDQDFKSGGYFEFHVKAREIRSGACKQMSPNFLILQLQAAWEDLDHDFRPSPC